MLVSIQCSPFTNTKMLVGIGLPPSFFFSPPFVCFNRASANTAKTCSATAKSITCAKVMSALLCWEAWPSLRRGRTHTLPGQAVTATIVGLLSPAAWQLVRQGSIIKDDLGSPWAQSLRSLLEIHTLRNPIHKIQVTEDITEVTIHKKIKPWPVGVSCTPF